ncbi:MAG: PTS sugar transporter [Desulfarculus sp.]|nr:PTS sugar transporter [Desulfarculus sp.]
MIGLVIISHARLARELVNAAEFILGKIEQVETVAVEANLEADHLRRLLTGALEKADKGDGVLILTDMFGGTPNNISLAFLEPGQVEVVTGMNLPMLIKAATARQGKGLEELARVVCEAGKGAISVAGELLAH